ncbi:glutamate--tRNA ligase [Candidatus Caldatribacterium saccharofermentans]|uniref:glutamate--tRNA ligase n=1 Tax=Candidatus Caldatribacterium saccharofermentans TaxID=1454753 RepID=UPI003CFE681C
MNETVRVRFAPSPTGFLHLGGARTALFNWAFARKYGGVFVLRIEDTDLARSTEESVQVILESLRWLGLLWDEGPEVGGPYGPYFQSQRLHLYREYAERLLEKGLAYECFCTPEELKERKERVIAQGKSWRYDRRCLHLSAREREAFRREGRKPALRFRIPEGTTTFVDMLRGDVTFDNSELDDFVILKSDGMPTYNFACVVDDALMRITHVIRGDDHISNTPRQVLLYEAFGFPCPQFAHIPMILGKDRTRLSKRHGSPSVTYYRDMGYLPEAMVNYLARLSWATGEEEKEIFTREEIIERFSLEQVTKHAAIFDLDKLNWMNGVYLRAADPERLAEILIDILKRQGKVTEKDLTPEFFAYCRRVMALMRDRIRYVAQILEEAEYFFTEHYEYDPQAVESVLFEEKVPEILRTSYELLKDLEPFDAQTIEKAIRAEAERRGLKAAQFIHPLRVAVSGKKVGPGLFELLEVLGKERVLARIARTLGFLERG